MRIPRVFAAGSLVSLVGLVLLLVEVIQTVGSNALGGAGTLLLWLGLGLFVVGAGVVMLGVVRDESDG